MKRGITRNPSRQSRLNAGISAWVLALASLVAIVHGGGQQETAATQARATSSPTDQVMRAMGDELERSITQLKLNDLDKPYFIQYTVYEDEDYTASATFGALSRSTLAHQRLVHAQVRVGDYTYDNTGFAGGRGGNAANGVLAQASVEDDYNALRHDLWLATDSAYKSAVETIAQKRAYTQGRTQQDDPLPDFSKEKATTSISPCRVR